MGDFVAFFKSLLKGRGLRPIIRGGLRTIFGKRGQRRVRGLRLYYRMRLLMLTFSVKGIGHLSGTSGVRLWVDGSEAFPRIEKLFARARHSIVMQMFIWKDDETGRRMARRLLEAADRGVRVDISKEALGDIFEFAGDFLGTQTQDHPLWKRFWSHPRIRVNHGAHMDHAKVYVIDDSIFLLTGMNVANEYRNEWHDYLVEIRGHAFVKQYLTRTVAPGVNPSVRLVTNTEEAKDIRPVMTKLLREAKHAVVVEHCYLSDPDILGEIVSLSKRKVAVTVILPAKPDFYHHANMTAVGQLLAEGDRKYLRILLYPGMFHGKILLIDYKKAFLGSANLMRSSLDAMGEVNVLIEGSHHALWKLQETLRMDALKSRPLAGPPAFLWISRWLAWLGL